MSQDPQSSQPRGRFPLRDKPVRDRSILESWAVLPARSRLYISLGITAFAAVGLWASDQLEEVVPATPEPSTSTDRQK